jgi:cyclase
MVRFCGNSTTCKRTCKRTRGLTCEPPQFAILACAIILLLCLVAPARLAADSVNTTKRTVTKLADGVYEIRHSDAPDTFPQGNTLVIIGDTSVLVVDSCYLQSSAREDITQIRQWTDKPVRFLVNTHEHGDHNFGNRAYADAFPGISIIAQAETLRTMKLRQPPFVAQYQERAVRFQKELDEGKDGAGNPLSEVGRQDLRDAIAGSNAVWPEFRELKLRFPDVTFDKEMNIDLGNRVVELKYLGLGNTVGDAVVYLPKERILATGDLVDSPVPYLGGGFPVAQIETLKTMLRLDADTIVPGHGDVLRGKSYVEMEIAFLEAVVGAINDEIGRSGATAHRRLAEIKVAVAKNAGIDSWRQKFAGDDPENRDFFDSLALTGVVEAAHAELWPQ